MSTIVLAIEKSPAKQFSELRADFDLPTTQTNHSYVWLITFGCNGFTERQLNRLRSPKQIKSFVFRPAKIFWSV